MRIFQIDPAMLKAIHSPVGRETGAPGRAGGRRQVVVMHVVAACAGLRIGRELQRPAAAAEKRVADGALNDRLSAKRRGGPPGSHQQ